MVKRVTEQGQEIYVHNIKLNNAVPCNYTNACNNIVPVMLNHNLMPTADTALVSYTKCEFAPASLVQQQMNILGWPTQKYHEDIIAHNTLHNLLKKNG